MGDLGNQELMFSQVFLDESGIKDNASITYDCKDKKSRRYRAIQLHHKKRISMMGDLGNQELIFPQVFLTVCSIKKRISMMGDLGNNPPIIMRIQ